MEMTEWLNVLNTIESERLRLSLRMVEWSMMDRVEEDTKVDV